MKEKEKSNEKCMKEKEKDGRNLYQGEGEGRMRHERGRDFLFTVLNEPFY